MRATSRHLLIGTLLLLFVSLMGLAGYRIAGWGWMDAAYMVVITIFSVGYGEVRATTPELKVFTMGLIFAGCSAYVYIVGAFINWLTEGQLQRILGKRKMAQEIKALEGHSIICGYGRIGRMLSSELQKAHKAFVVIEQDPERAQMIREKGYLCVSGDATDEGILLEAGLENANELATVLPNDAINVFIVLSARNLRPDLTIIARGNQPTSEPKLKQAGANRVVLPAHIGAERIAHLILKPSARDFLEYDLHDPQFLDSLSEIGLEMEEIPIPEGSYLTGNTLEQLETREKSAFIVVAVKKSSSEILPKPALSTVLETGDTLIVMSHAGVVPEFVRRNMEGNRNRYRGATVD